MSEKLTLFDRFGGTRKMADALGEASSTVQSWKTAGRIPAFKQPDVLAKAQELRLDVTAEDIIFPLGHDDMEGDRNGSPTKSGDLIRSASGGTNNSCENIREGEEATEKTAEADSRGPFSMGSPSTSSTTGEPQSTQPDSPSCSTSTIDQGEQPSLPLSSRSKAA